jgi:nitronate monooxygenase
MRVRQTDRVTSAVLSGLTVPIVQAPMAGGPSTTDLAMAVDRAGGLGFIAAGYLSTERLRSQIAAVREVTERFGVNVFIAGHTPANSESVSYYASVIGPEADRAGVALGAPRYDDDHFAAKIELLESEPVAAVSFTFGLPEDSVVSRLHAAGSEVWFTVTSPEEARQAEDAGGDVLIVQGVEAGGHRGVFTDDDSASDLSLLAALQLVQAVTDLPLVAAGSIMTGRALAAVLVAGAAAGQLGTAFMLTPEAGTSPAQRKVTASSTPTILTRAFSGRMARGIRNRFSSDYSSLAPPAYPEINHLTAPLRSHARSTGDADLINLWAGQAHSLVSAASAEEITRAIWADAEAALATAARRWI